MIKHIKCIFNSKLVKAGSWYTLTDFFLKGMNFLTIPIFTGIMGPEDYGIQSLYVTWSLILSTVCSMSLFSSIANAKYEFKENFEDYVSSITFFSVLLFIPFLILAVVFYDSFSKVIGFNGGIYYLLIAYSFLLSINNILLAKFRVEYNYKKISIINIAISLLSLVSAIILSTTIFKEKAYLGKIIGNSVFYIIFGLIALAYLLRNSRKLIRFDFWKFALLYSIPLVFHSLSSMVNNHFDRLVIKEFCSASELGLYSLSYSIGTALIIIVHALDFAWSPFVYELLDEGKTNKIKNYSYPYRDVVTIVFLGILFLSPEVLRIMSSEAYWPALDVIPLVLLGYFFTFMYTLEVKIEFFYKKTTLVSIGTILSALINIVTNYIFVPKYGYIAAAFTTTFSYFFLFAFHYFMVVYVMKKKLYDLKFHIKSIITGILSVIVFYYFKEQLLMRLIILCLLVLYYGFGLIRFYKNMNNSEGEV